MMQHSTAQHCWLVAQGFCASLELLPMWSGVEPDTELFASGRVLDDDGEWSGGQTLDDSAAGQPHVHVANMTRLLQSLADAFG